MVFFCLREISPIKVGVSKIIFEELEQQKEKETTLLNYYDKKVKKLRQTHSEKIKKIKSELVFKMYQKIKKKNAKLNMVLIQ